MNRNLWTGIVSAAGIMALILDAQTALRGAQEGIALCLYSVIPSLFPFLALSSIINNSLGGLNLRFLRPLGRACGISKGAESIFLLGLVGGYPVGAQAIGQAYQEGRITRENGQRMLAFCNNAGPAFIFGMLSHFFSSTGTVFCIWAIQILSAILVGIILPKCREQLCSTQVHRDISISRCVRQSLQAMAVISGWVVLFRVLLAYLQKWFLWFIPREIGVVISGILELSNGCVSLGVLKDEALRFISANIMLSFGGLCVCMQTVAVIGKLKMGSYLKGKLLQICSCFLLSFLMLPLLFPAYGSLKSISFIIAVVAIIAVFFKKVVAISEKLLYDKKKEAMR